MAVDCCGPEVEVGDLVAALALGVPPADLEMSEIKGTLGSVLLWRPDPGPRAALDDAVVGVEVLGEDEEIPPSPPPPR